jgi:hypothetical protein
LPTGGDSVGVYHLEARILQQIGFGPTAAWPARDGDREGDERYGLAGVFTPDLRILPGTDPRGAPTVWVTDGLEPQIAISWWRPRPRR